MKIVCVASLSSFPKSSFDGDFDRVRRKEAEEALFPIGGRQGGQHEEGSAKKEPTDRPTFEEDLFFLSFSFASHLHFCNVRNLLVQQYQKSFFRLQPSLSTFRFIGRRFWRRRRRRRPQPGELLQPLQRATQKRLRRTRHLSNARPELLQQGATQQIARSHQRTRRLSGRAAATTPARSTRPLRQLKCSTHVYDSTNFTMRMQVAKEKATSKKDKEKETFSHHKMIFLGSNTHKLTGRKRGCNKNVIFFFPFSSSSCLSLLRIDQNAIRKKRSFLHSLNSSTVIIV